MASKIPLSTNVNNEASNIPTLPVAINSNTYRIRSTSKTRRNNLHTSKLMCNESNKTNESSVQKPSPPNKDGKVRSPSLNLGNRSKTLHSLKERSGEFSGNPHNISHYKLKLLIQ